MPVFECRGGMFLLLSEKKTIPFLYSYLRARMLNKRQSTSAQAVLSHRQGIVCGAERRQTVLPSDVSQADIHYCNRL